MVVKIQVLMEPLNSVYSIGQTFGNLLPQSFKETLGDIVGSKWVF